MSDLTNLYDIEGIDPISWWPLAPGWWGVIALSILLISGLLLYFHLKRVARNKWQHITLNQLSLLHKNLTEDNMQTILIELSHLIRRIAMHKYSRAACAGLEGVSWLLWLEKHDPAHFKWTTKGISLVEAPYAPFYPLSPQEINVLIKAIRRWVS